MKLLIFALACLSAATAQEAVKVTRVVAMEYPWFARMAILQGKVELLATISKDGSPENIRVVSGVTILALAAKESLAKWRFAGCECDVKFNFTFELSGSSDAESHCPAGFEVDLPGNIRVTAKAINAIVN